MHKNSVSSLRLKQHEALKKPFSARGSKLKRCVDCLLVEHHCICAHRSTQDADCAFCFIFYQGEVLKPSNTGRLVADLIPDNHAYQWQRTELDSGMAALLNNPHYLPIVIFPHEYATTHQCISHPRELEGYRDNRKPLFIVLDGTWREAKKMFRSAYLKSLPVLGLNPEEASNYQLRESSKRHQLCTAEVAIEVLKIVEEAQSAQALATYFERFKERYLASKANIVLS